MSQNLISQPLKSANAKPKDSIRSQQMTSDWPKRPPPGDRSIPSISSVRAESKPTKSEVKGFATISQTSVKNIISAFEGDRSKVMVLHSSFVPINLIYKWSRFCMFDCQTCYILTGSKKSRQSH